MVQVIEGPVDTSPGEVRYDEERLALLQGYYARLVESGRVHGASFLLARDGKVIAERAMGRIGAAEDAGPLRPDSIKRVASITKVLTATAVMKLVEDGVLCLEQPVASLIPEFRTAQHGAITVWHLLTHTSGLLPDGGYYCEPYPVDTFPLLRQKNWLAGVALAGPPRFAPGAEWAYSSTGFMVLAELVARASGRSYPTYVQEEILAPLGMRRSFFAVPEPLWPEVAWAGDWDRESQQALRDHGFGEGGPPGGGGAFSTLRDLLQLGQCVLEGGSRHGRRVLGRKAMQEMLRNQLSGVPAFHWGHRLKDIRHGLGWGYYADGAVVGPATVVHAGWGWSTLYVDPVERFVYVAFVQDVADFDPVVQVNPVSIAFSGLR